MTATVLKAMTIPAATLVVAIALGDCLHQLQCAPVNITAKMVIFRAELQVQLDGAMQGGDIRQVRRVPPRSFPLGRQDRDDQPQLGHVFALPSHRAPIASGAAGRQGRQVEQSILMQSQR